MQFEEVESIIINSKLGLKIYRNTSVFFPTIFTKGNNCGFLFASLDDEPLPPFHNRVLSKRKIFAPKKCCGVFLAHLSRRLWGSL